jgi:hypothetical protein
MRRRSGVGPLATGLRRIDTSNMALKNAALFTLIGTFLLTNLLVAGFVLDVLNVARDLVPAIRMSSSLIHTFAALALTVFSFCVPQKPFLMPEPMMV